MTTEQYQSGTDLPSPAGEKGRANVTSRRLLPSARYYGYIGPQAQRPFREYLVILYEYRYFILLLTLLGFLYGSDINRRTPPQFTSSALATIGIYVPPVSGPISDAIKIETTRKEYFGTLVSLLKSYKIATKVLTENPRIRTRIDPGFRPAPTAQGRVVMDSDGYVPINVLNRYLGMISFQPMDGTTLVKISATASSAELAAEIANVHAETFTDIVRQQRLESAQIDLEALQRREGEAARKVEEANHKLIEFAKNNSIGFTDSETERKAMADKYASLIEGLSMATQDRAAAEVAIQESRRTRDTGFTLENSDLYLKLNELSSKRDRLFRLNRFDPAIPLLDDQISSLKKTVKETNGAKIREGEVKRRALMHREAVMRQELATLKASEVERSSLRLEYEILERAHQAAKDQLDQVRSQLDDAAVIVESDQKTVNIVDKAVSPPTANPNKAFSVLLTWSLQGLLLGTILVFLYDFRRSCIRSVNELQRAVKAPVLSVVPAFSQKLKHTIGKLKQEALEAGGGTVAQVLPGEGGDLSGLDHASTDIKEVPFDLQHGMIGGLLSGIFSRGSNPDSRHAIIAPSFSRESEAFRTLAINLKHGKAAAPKIILVTSAQKGDGKTTIATNLAASLAQSEARTLLVDGDLRLPKVHTYFNLPRARSGLVECLQEPEADVFDHIVREVRPHLSLLLTGNETSIPGELLAREGMKQIMPRLGESFDYVIIDAPPVSYLADALMLSRLADGVIVVVRSGETPKPLVQLAIKRLEQVQASVLGVVFNDVKRSRTLGENEYYLYS